MCLCKHICMFAENPHANLMAFNRRNLNTSILCMCANVHAHARTLEYVSCIYVYLQKITRVYTWIHRSDLNISIQYTCASTCTQTCTRTRAHARTHSIFLSLIHTYIRTYIRITCRLRAGHYKGGVYGHDVMRCNVTNWSNSAVI
jgi:hypothetical protein